MSDSPIVLVHGLFGFDRLTLGGADYFRLIPKTLRDAGHVVPKPPRLNLAGRIEDRAVDLRTFLTTHPDVVSKPVHLIAHSMGGLDARFMLHRDPELTSRVKTLTTIGTPHHGSPIADLVVAGGHPLLARFLARLGVDIHGIGDLTTEACRRFNGNIGDPPGVRCFSIAGRFDPPTILGAPLGVLAITYTLIRNREDDNDGLVSVESAKFGADPVNWKYLGAWEANHFRLINWGANFVPTPAELADESIAEKYKALVATILEE
jgi:triacylglycerol lipase